MEVAAALKSEEKEKIEEGGLGERGSTIKKKI